MFNGKRLRLARKRRQMTARRFAEALGVTPVTISRWERGYNEPSPTILAAIAEALRFPPDFFLQDDLDEPVTEAASFRGLTAMTAKERNAALAAGALAYLFTDWVRERFNLPKPDLLDLGELRGEHPERAARMLREYWGLGERPIKNMVHLLEAKGVRVFSLAENTKSVDAFSCWRGEEPYIFLNTMKSAERRRFDAGHELGHLVLHKHGGTIRSREAEREADRFAASFLMPHSDVISQVPYVRSLDQLVRFKKRWRVSVAALAYRLHELDIISDWNYRTICIQINKRGYNKKEPNPILPETSIVWKRIFESLWREGVTKGDIAKSIYIPLEEIENLVAGLLLNSNPPQCDEKRFPPLRLIE